MIGLNISTLEMCTTKKQKEIVIKFPQDVRNSIKKEDIMQLDKPSKLNRILEEKDFDSHNDLRRYLAKISDAHSFWSYDMGEISFLKKTHLYINCRIVCFGNECRIYEMEIM
jgi:hypothetical protein